jgi:hypothetical protein
MINETIYRKQHTYLVIENETNEYVRWATPTKDIFYAGSVADALIGLPEDGFRAIAVCDAPTHIQKEYEEAIDKAIMDGTLELKDMLPKELSVFLCYYVDDDGNFVFDEDEMINNFSTMLKQLEIISEKYKK